MEKEQLSSLLEYQKIVHPIENLPTVNIGDIVVHEKFQPQMLWKVGIVDGAIKGSDGYIRGALVRIPITNSLIKRPVNYLSLWVQGQCKCWTSSIKQPV